MGHAIYVNGTLVKYAANAIGAAGRVGSAVVHGQQILAPIEEQRRRIGICEDCEFFVANPMKCQKCGCYLNLKTRLETEHCPIDKW